MVRGWGRGRVAAAAKGRKRRAACADRRHDGWRWRRVLSSRKCRRPHVDFWLLLHDIVSNENDQDKADNHENGDDLTLQDRDDCTVDHGIASQVPEEANFTEQSGRTNRAGRSDGLYNRGVRRSRRESFCKANRAE